MSRDKRSEKRGYKVRGAATKRKLKRLRAKGGPPSRSGYKWVVYCPECERPNPIAVGSDTAEAECKQGHKFKVV